MVSGIIEYKCQKDDKISQKFHVIWFIILVKILVNFLFKSKISILKRKFIWNLWRKKLGEGDLPMLQLKGNVSQ